MVWPLCAEMRRGIRGPHPTHLSPCVEDLLNPGGTLGPGAGCTDSPRSRDLLVMDEGSRRDPQLCKDAAQTGPSMEF